MDKHNAIYLRVSGKMQDTASQESDLKRWADAQEGQESVLWYHDTFTGTTMNRPGWNQLERAIHQGQVSKVVCWRIDRLGRTAKGLTALFEDLVKRKINLVSLKDGLDLSTPAGRLMAHVLASVAAYETEVRRERIVAGLAVAKENGVKLGRKPGIHTKIKVTPDQERIAQEMLRRGEKKASIARATGLSRHTIYHILKTPTRDPC
jgi:DNA invertase Pin-like site-specific DNA recombinase